MIVGIGAKYKDKDEKLSPKCKSNGKKDGVKHYSRKK